MTGNSANSTISTPLSWTLYRTLVGIGLICALVIVTAFEVTLPIISANKKQALQNAIYQILPTAKIIKAYTVINGVLQPATNAGNSAVIYACYAADKSLAGFAIPANGMGYQDAIQLLYGYSLSQQAVQGMVVLENRETPGLGGKIADDPAFLGNFTTLKLDLVPPDYTLEHPLAVLKNRPKTEPWQIDAITGATISSNAVVSIMNRSLSFWVPLITRQQERFIREH